MRTQQFIALGAILGTSVLAACSGGGSAMRPGGLPVPTPPTSTPGGPSTQQVIKLAIPTGSIGIENDPTFGKVGGFTQTTFSQVLGFAPGSQVMIQNADTSGGNPHTLGVFSSAPPFPGSQGNELSTSASGGSTLAAGFQTGTLAPGSMVGPITLQAGTYYIGCAFHYSIGMRDVVVVQSNAAPGPAATPIPGSTTPPSGGGY